MASVSCSKFTLIHPDRQKFNTTNYLLFIPIINFYFYIYTYVVLFLGMDPVAKTKLIESLYKVLVSLGVLSPENVKVIIYTLYIEACHR